jgi:hypothetical protein
MRITLPDISEPFWVYQSYDIHTLYKYHIDGVVYQDIANSDLTSFVVISLEQRHFFNSKLPGSFEYGMLESDVQLWKQWSDDNFEQTVRRFWMTHEMGSSRYHGPYLYGFKNPQDAIMFKLTWI